MGPQIAAALGAEGQQRVCRGLEEGSPHLLPGSQPGGRFLLGAHWFQAGGALTSCRCRNVGTLCSPHRRAAGSHSCTGTCCRGTGHGHCKRSPAGSGSPLWTVGTGRPSPRSPVCRGTCHSGIHHGLENSRPPAQPPLSSPRPPTQPSTDQGPALGPASGLASACLPHRPLCSSPVPPQTLPL